MFTNEADHSPQSSAEVKSRWSYTSAPLLILHGVVEHSLTVTSSPVHMCPENVKEEAWSRWWNFFQWSLSVVCVVN